MILITLFINALQKSGNRNADNQTIQKICEQKGIPFPLQNPEIIIFKSRRILTLYNGNKLIKAYKVSLGENPKEDKNIEGDKCTPEGTFYICQMAKNPQKIYLGSRWMRISYPSIEDAKRGLENGLIAKDEYEKIVEAIKCGKIPPQNTNLGGGIGIHGGNELFEKNNNWTAGCIGLYNKDIEEIYDCVKVGVPIIIIS
ncbi:MAG TPA: murein L,D-transpeptidase [Actinobacteria bacterium]|nr:murein L,D-transpeptidase [Actinomycetota bacterium]